MYEMLRFTSTENECCGSGDRIPTVMLSIQTEGIHVNFQVGDENNYVYKNTKIPPKIWTKVEIKQYPEDGKV